MKISKLTLVFVVACIVYAGCSGDSKKTVLAKKVVEKPTQGDFNGDGKIETVQLIKPQLAKDGESCVGPCTAYLQFSDTTIKRIEVANCIGGKPDNLGDLNGDGKDEIGLLPDWFTSCWRDYFVYTYKNDNWIKAVPPILTHCNQWEANIKPIEKDSLNKGYVVIRYSAFERDSIVNKSKIISIQ